jgi:uncharacterized membrane protein
MDDKRQLEYYERAHDPARVLTLSDGVFAIIITLLVLELHVPDLAQGQSLRDAGREIRPSFIAFLISFVVVAISWAGHRDLFSLIRRTNRALVWLNLLYLLPLCVIPFAASLISRYDKDSTALRLYGLDLVLIALARLLIWWYATGRTHLLFDPVDSRSRWMGVILVVVPGLAYSVAILISESSPRASLAIYAAVPILYFVAITIARTTALAESAEREFT